MLDHETIHSYLFDAFAEQYGDRAVSLVARFHDPALALRRGRAHVFIPDCHLLSHRESLLYPKWGFKQDDDLILLLEVLTALKTDHPAALEVWHLGDLLEVWRARGLGGDAGKVRRIAADHADIIDRLQFGPPNGVRARLMAGNHDLALYRLPEWRAARYRFIEAEDPEHGDVLVVHGDMFAWIERFPEGLKAAASRAATWISSGGKDLSYRDGSNVVSVNRGVSMQDEPVGTGDATLSGGGHNGADAYNVVDGKRRDDPAKYFAAARELAVALRERGHNIRAVVIGHTHHARIVAGDHDGGGPFVLLDAGAWIGRCRLRPTGSWGHSAQIGVIVDDDLRIYQVGWRSA